MIFLDEEPVIEKKLNIQDQKEQEENVEAQIFINRKEENTEILVILQVPDEISASSYQKESKKNILKKEIQLSEVELQLKSLDTKQSKIPLKVTKIEEPDNLETENLQSNIQEDIFSLLDSGIVEARESNVMFKFNNSELVTEDFCTDSVLQTENIQTEIPLVFSDDFESKTDNEITSKELEDSSRELVESLKKLEEDLNLLSASSSRSINSSNYNDVRSNNEILLNVIETENLDEELKNIEFMFQKNEEAEKIFINIIIAFEECVEQFIQLRKSKTNLNDEKEFLTEKDISNFKETNTELEEGVIIKADLLFTKDNQLNDLEVNTIATLTDQSDDPTIPVALVLQENLPKRKTLDPNKEFVTGLTESISSLDSTEAAFYAQQRSLLMIDFPEDESSTTSSLDQGQPPIFYEHLYNTEFVVGKKAQLKCVVTGTPTPEIAWFVDDNQITNTE